MCVIPGHAVKGVEIAGGQKLALEALRGGGAGMLGRNCVGGIGMIPVLHFQPGASAPKPERGMSLEFLRSYSNPPAAAAASSSPAPSSSSSSNHHAGLGGGGGLHGNLNGGNGLDYNKGYNNNRGGPGMNHLSRGGVDGLPYGGDFGGYGMTTPNGVGAGAGGGFGLGHGHGHGHGPAGGTGITGMGLEAVAERRRRVRSALEHARVPVEEVRESNSPAPALVVMGCVRVPPPYTADACECANEIVLSKVRQLVDNVR